MKKFCLFFVLVLPLIVNAQVITHPKTDAEMAQAFVVALQSCDVNNLLALAPTVDVFRMTAPEETKGKSDKEVMEMAKPMYEKLEEDFKLIQQEAAKKKIDLGKIVIKNQKISQVPYSPQGFYGMEIAFNYKKKKGTFTFGITIIGDIYYIYEIEKTVAVFKGM